MNVLFRCDASPDLGLGHLRRCLTLAAALREQQPPVRLFFSCRCGDIDPVSELREVCDDWEIMDMSVPVEADAARTVGLARTWGIDVTVVDHYRASESYQRELRASGLRWLQFDWSASEPLLADWILNAGPAANEEVYRRITPQTSRLLLGPAYALVRPGFSSGRPRGSVSNQVRRILLTFGGGDDRGMTISCLNALEPLDRAIERLVVVGDVNPASSNIRHWAESHGAARLAHGTQMAAAFAQADIAIIAGGTTTFEAAAMGVPAIIIQIADNQAPNARAWQQLGAAIDLGTAAQFDGVPLRSAVTTLMHDSARRLSMSLAGLAAVDGLGAQRVSRALLCNEID